jgi:prepilin-type N-terminal cleavage/methylation domain-containing protein
MDKRVAGRCIYGFTLVELAIVLVVIGIIAAMAIGGTDVLANAQVRSEINKLSKFESALSTYRAANNRFPKLLDNNSTDRTLDTFALVGLGVESKDLKSKFANNTQDQSAYQLQYCAPKLDNISVGFTMGSSEASNICLNVGMGVEIDGTYKSEVENNIHNLLVCNAEILIDDSNILTGSARNFDGGIPTTETSNWGSAGGYNCDNVSNAYTKFGYKIF